MEYKNINLTKFIDILNIQSHSKDETRMVHYLINEVVTMIEDGADIILEYDDEGNIYITKGLSNHYPTVVAHIDTVHDVNMDVEVRFNENGDLIAYDTVKNAQYGIGGDDKVGVYIALEMLSKFDAIKVALFSREEIGCIGSGNCRKEFFDDSAFLIQCDRRGSEDLIKYGHAIQLFGEDFDNAISPYLTKWGYKIEAGGQTDVVELKETGLGVACFNMSCGYYMPHTSTEYIRLVDVERCAGLVFDIIDNLSTQLWKHVFTKKPTGYSKYDIKDFDDFYAGRQVDKKVDKIEETVVTHANGSKTVYTYKNGKKTCTVYYPPNYDRLNKKQKKAFKKKALAEAAKTNSENLTNTNTPLLLGPKRTLPLPPSHMEWDQDAYNGFHPHYTRDQREFF